MQYQELCSKILGLDRSIRYVAIADHLGSLLASVYREGLVPLASKEESAKYASRAVFMTGASGGGFSSKVGKLQYAVGKYENLVRATVPLVSGSYDKFYLMLSLDVDSDFASVIEKKVIKFLQDRPLPI